MGIKTKEEIGSEPWYVFYDIKSHQFLARKDDPDSDTYVMCPNWSDSRILTISKTGVNLYTKIDMNRVHNMSDIGSLGVEVENLLLVKQTEDGPDFMDVVEYDELDESDESEWV